MSKANVKVVRDGYEYFGANHDFRVEAITDDFVWDMSTFRGWPEQKTYEGLEGARKFIADWSGAWEDWRLEVDELIDAGEDKVLAILHQTGRSKATGLPVDMHFAQVWTVRDGKQAYMAMYAGPDEAREAVGEKPG